MQTGLRAEPIPSQRAKSAKIRLVLRSRQSLVSRRRWAGLWWPHIYHVYFSVFAAGTNHKNNPRTGLTIDWSPKLIFCATCAMFRATARPKAPGARRGPRGPRIGQKPEAGFTPLSCPRSAQGFQDVAKPYEFIGFGAMDVTKPYEFIWFGAMDGRH